MHDEEHLWTISEAARRTGLSVKLLRHWSDVGVAPASLRSEAGYRLYDTDALARLQLARTLRDLGMGLAAIKDVVSRGRTLADVAAAHADALESQIRALRSQQAVLRSAARRGTTPEGLAAMTALTRMSAAERRSVVEEFVTTTLEGLDVPAFRRGLLAAAAELPDDPGDEQVDAWLELGALVRDPTLRTGMRRMARYVAEHAPGEHGEEARRATERAADAWLRRVEAARRERLAADSPAAEPVVAAVVADWLPSQAHLGNTVPADGEDARRLLLEQLESASEPLVERFWQLLCRVNDQPVPPSVAEAGRWLTTALRAHPAPGHRAARLAGTYDDGADAWAPDGVLRACERTLDTVGAMVAAVGPDRFGDPTPCADWDVRALLDHLVWENLLWGGLARGAPRSDVDADHLGTDHVEAFRAAAAGTWEAFSRPGMLEERFGPAPGWRLVEQLVLELLVHGWDLARATGQDRDVLPDLAEAALPVVQTLYGDLPRTPGGSFAPPADVPADASPLDRLAARLGRTP